MAHQGKSLKVLKIQRTKLLNKTKERIEKFAQIQETELNPENAEDIATDVEIGISILTDLATRLESLWDEVISLTDDSANELLENECEQFENELGKVKEAIARLQSKLKKTQLLTKLSTSRDEPSPVGNVVDLQEKIDQLIQLQNLRLDATSQGHSGQQRPAVRLPKIEFDKFGGNVLELKEFWDHFNFAIHSNRQLQPVEKLNYLRAYLTGEAKQVIAGLTATDENYNVATDLLQTRYGNTQASIDAHYTKLLDQPAVPNNTSSLRKLMDKVESHLRCLQALGENIDHRHFISIIMLKLPRELVAHLEETKGSEVQWTVELLRTKLHNILRAREIAERQNGQSSGHPPVHHSNRSSYDDNTTTTHKNGNNGRFKFGSHSFAKRSTTETLVASEKKVSSSNYRPNGPCVFCSRNNHFHVDCRTVNTLENRRQILRDSKRCFNCLQQGHSIKDCRSKKTCYYCKKAKAHHQSICPTYFSPKESVAVATEEQASEAENATLSTGETALLQTASIQVKNPSSSSTTATRALLDCGSSRTYITSQLARKLQLQTQQEEHFSIGTFGSQKRKTVRSSIAQVHIKLKDGKLKLLDVNIIDKITGPVTRMPIKVDISNITKRFADFSLADHLPTKAEKSEIGLLIGSDYYLDIINTERLEVKPGLYLLDSKLGWLLTGRVESNLVDRNDITMFVDSRVNSVAPQVRTQFATVKLDEEVPIKPNMQDLWSLESIGIKDNPEVIDDDKAIQAFNSTVTISEDGRYQVCWPWKDSNPDLPDNYQMSLGRFKVLAKKFIRKF